MAGAVRVAEVEPVDAHRAVRVDGSGIDVHGAGDAVERPGRGAGAEAPGAFGIRESPDDVHTVAVVEPADAHDAAVRSGEQGVQFHVDEGVAVRRADEAHLEGVPLSRLRGRGERRRGGGDLVGLVRRVGSDRRGVGGAGGAVTDLGERSPERVAGGRLLQLRNERDELAEAGAAELLRHGRGGDAGKVLLEHRAAGGAVERIAERAGAIEHGTPQIRGSSPRGSRDRRRPAPTAA